MADYLTTALGGLGTTTGETPWGYAGKTLLEASPLLINQKRPSGGNLAAAFGTALLGGLIAYKGRQDAAEQTAEAASLSQQIQSAATPEERLAIAQSAESSGVRTKLTSLVNALGMQDVANARDLAQKKSELMATYEAEMSPLGQALANRKAAQRIAEIDALYNRKQDLQDSKGNKVSTPEAAAVISRLASEFEKLNLDVTDWNIQKEKPGTPANLVWSRLQNAYGLIAKLGGQDKISDVDTALAKESVIGRNINGFSASDTNDIAARLKGYLPVDMVPLATAPMGSIETSDWAEKDRKAAALGYYRDPITNKYSKR